jgi:hypothetical protein
MTMDHFDYRKLNPGIRNVVKLLRHNEFLGVETEGPDDTDIAVLVPAHALTKTADRICGLLMRSLTSTSGVDVVATYSVFSEESFVMITGVTDDMLRG